MVLGFQDRSGRLGQIQNVGQSNIILGDETAPAVAMLRAFCPKFCQCFSALGVLSE